MPFFCFQFLNIAFESTNVQEGHSGVITVLFGCIGRFGLSKRPLLGKQIMPLRKVYK